MKKLFLILAVLFGLTAIAACGNKTEKGTAEEQTEAVAEAAEDTDFDIEGLNALMDKSKEELSEKDYDFLLDQCEILMEQTKGMTDDQKMQYLGELGEEKAGAVMVITIGLAAAEKSGKLTPSQLEKFRELEEMDK